MALRTSPAIIYGCMITGKVRALTRIEMHCDYEMPCAQGGVRGVQRIQRSSALARPFAAESSCPRAGSVSTGVRKCHCERPVSRLKSRAS